MNEFEARKMRSAGVLILFVSSIALANPESFSVSGGLSAIHSDIGYFLGVITPYANHTALAFQFNQFLTEEDTSYGLITAEAVHQIYLSGKFTVLFKLGGFASLWQEGNESTLGLKLSIGNEFFYSQFVGVYSELGWSFPIKKSGALIAQGGMISLGMKYYF